VKCEVDGVELIPRVVTSPNSGSSELNFDSYMGEDFLTLRFNNRDKNNAFLAVRIVIKNFNPNETDLTGMIIDLHDDSTGMYSINTQIEYSTNLEYIGEFKIVNHDQSERILSSRFWYGDVNLDNEIRETRNGQFATKY
jgi:hypothetical protein